MAKTPEDSHKGKLEYNATTPQNSPMSKLGRVAKTLTPPADHPTAGNNKRKHIYLTATYNEDNKEPQYAKHPPGTKQTPRTGTDDTLSKSFRKYRDSQRNKKSTRRKTNQKEQQPNDYQQPPALLITSQEQWATNYRLLAAAKLQVDCKQQARLQASLNNQTLTLGAHRNPVIKQDRHKRHTTATAQEGNAHATLPSHKSTP